MIASLRGKVASRRGNAVVIDVAGVGYLVHASARTVAALGEVGDDAFLVIETQVREDAISLYGFLDDEERDTFELLVGVQGVGPKAALSLLSAMSAIQLLAAVADGNRADLCRADGIGARLAARITTELAEKAGRLYLVFGGPRGAGAVINEKGEAAEIGEVRSALARLGFGKAETETMLAEVLANPDQPRDTASLITAGLRSRKAA